MKLTVKLLALLGWAIVFWNVENFFDPAADSTNPSELSFTPGGSYRWTYGRFKTKARAIAKVVLSLSDSTGAPPEFVGLCEVENERCLRELVYGTALRKYGYRYIHYDSPDPRGIDCVALYRPESPLGRLRSSGAVPIRDSSGAALPTRALLVAEFDSLAVVVCHLPSKRGGSELASRRRILALQTLSRVCDSLSALRPVVALGDFNDTRTSLSDSLMCPMRELTPSGSPGTLRFEGRWEQIDRTFASPGLDAGLHIAALPLLSTPDKKHGGTKPLRTYSGPRYLGGVSDHYPIILYICVPRKTQNQ